MTDVDSSYTMSYMNPDAIATDADDEALVFQAPVRTVSIKFHKGCCHGRKDKARK